MKDLAHLEIREYFQIPWKRRWYFLVVAVLVISGASVYAWRMPDVFKSETRILVDEPFVPTDYARQTPRTTPEDRIGMIRQQLASRTFLERMIEQFQMFGYGTRPDFVMEAAVRAAQRQIGIEKTSNNTFTISFVATDPQFAQTVARQLAQELIRISTNTRKDRVVATDEFVDEQLRQSAEALAAEEEKIKQFKLAHLGELPEQGAANMNALTGLHSQLTAVETALQQAQERQKLLDFRWQERRRLDLISRTLDATKDPKPGDKGQNAISSTAADLATKKALLDQYRLKYTANHPDVAALTREISRLEQQVGNQSPQDDGSKGASGADSSKSVSDRDPMESAYQFESNSIKDEIARREKERQEIRQQIKGYQGRLQLAPALEQELATLLREQEMLKTRYEGLQKQKFGTQMATTAENDKKNETYKVIDEANLPVRPESPNRVQLVLLGIGGGLALGIGAAFGRELLDSTIGSEDEAKRILDLPVLVTIPIAPTKKTAKYGKSPKQKEAVNG